MQRLLTCSTEFAEQSGLFENALGEKSAGLSNKSRGEVGDEIRDENKMNVKFN